MEQMSALDAAFLDVEDAVSHMHIGSVGIFEGPAPDGPEAARMISGKLHLVPRYRQVVRGVPLGLGRRFWADDPCFDLDYHLRRTGLPAPGGEAELRSLVGRVMSTRLDRSRPLWEMWLAEGLPGGRWALISKIHHCMVDGVAGSDLLAALLDEERAPGGAEAPPWEPRPVPGDLSLAAGALRRGLRSPLTAAGALPAPGDLAVRAREAALGLLRLSELLRGTAASSLNGPVGPHRRWAWARGRLSEIKEVRAALGGTVNDVVLASIAGGFRALLIARGESTQRVLRTMVPVSVRSPGEHGEYNNRVSAMFAALPVAEEDPVARLTAVTRQMRDLKQSHEAVAGEVLTSLGGFAPPLLLSLAERLATRLPQQSVNTVTTNVPGPQRPLYAAGRRMLEAFPYVPLGGHVRVGVAIFSYDGACSFGVTGDWDSAPDVEVLCEGIEASLGELVEIARAASGKGLSRRSPRPRRARAGGRG